MIVIADSSPLIVLVNIGEIQILPALFGTVTIPPQVAEELAHPNRPQTVRDFITQTPSWLKVRSPLNVESIPLLQAGESAAISLARELDADLLLIDELKGRKAASARNLKFAGTIGVMEQAASVKLLDLQTTFDKLRQTDFWISHRLLDERLQLFNKHPNKPTP